MADDKTEDVKTEEVKEESPKKASKAPKSVEVGSSPNEDNSLPQGIYGGPATLDNPVRAAVVDKDKLNK